MANITDRAGDFCAQLGATLKSCVKMLFCPRPSTVSDIRPSGRLIILGNGPSLAANLADDMSVLRTSDTMAVNFAANAPEFFEIRPRYYLLADPHFFSRPSSDPNVERLYAAFARVSWDMTLIVPVGVHTAIDNPRIGIRRFNPTGIEGFTSFRHSVFRLGLGMPRPRNVLIPAIMTGIAMGYRRINILGADHSWLKTLGVDDDNRVVSIQPHFYKDNDEEHRRVASVYSNVRLHEMLLSMHYAFRSYHEIARYARQRGVEIINSTPGSYIDAFERHPL